MEGKRTHPGEPPAEHTWIERNVRPAVLLFVCGVFAGFMALAHFVFGSSEAVKALLLAAIGSVGATVPGVLRRTEYHLTTSALSKRTLGKEKHRAFEEVFKWDELSHLVPTRDGFKYYNMLEEPNPFLRFVKVHLLSDYSGEFRVRSVERAHVEAMADRFGLPRTKARRVIGPPDQA